MTTYVEYELEDGIKILVVAPDPVAGGVIKAARDAGGEAVVKASKKFSDALEAVHVQAKLMRKKFEDLRADDVEVKFGLTATLDAGNFAIGKIGVEATYEVTLKWKNKPEAEKAGPPA
jgi:hypothetical protein